MNASTENQSSNSLDSIKWVVIVALLVGAVVGNDIYGDQSVLFRAPAIVAAIVIAGFIAMQTEKGRNAVAFAKESRTEVRKVVWPTRQEAMQTTFIVLAATVVMAGILYLLDMVLFWAVGIVTGLQF